MIRRRDGLRPHARRPRHAPQPKHCRQKRAWLLQKELAKRYIVLHVTFSITRVGHRGFEDAG